MQKHLESKISNLKSPISNSRGQSLFLVIIVLVIVLISTLALVSGAQVFHGNSARSVNSEKVTGLAEAGLEKAVASLNSSGGVYDGELETILEDGSYSVDITDFDANTKIVQATGYYPSKANAKIKKTIKVTVSKGSGNDFNYGAQVGAGGLNMSNNSIVNGSVYSNGNITMSNNSRINGDAYVAGGVQPVPDQEYDCSGGNCFDYEFGRNTTQAMDMAQSFQAGTTAVINKVALKLKKQGNPANATVRILSNNNGVPNRNQVLAVGTLAASVATAQYSFVEVNFTSAPTLTQNTIYWIVMDVTTADNSNYWNWQLDSTSGYTLGAAKWSINYNSSSPWTNISGDLTFKTYMGGVSTRIFGSNGAIITGDAHANNLQSLTINGGAYYQTMNNITAGSLHPNSTDPVPVSMPISDANTQEWKDAATAAGVYTGNINTCPVSMPAGKYVGNITLANGCTVTVGSPIWVTGVVILSNNNTIKLNPNLGASSGVFMVDGVTSLANGNKFLGSGTAGSYLILIGTGPTQANPGATAISVTNGGNTGILYSNWGTINIGNNNTLTSVTGWRLSLSNGVVINYDQGLAGAFFSSGPSGSFSIMKGTYQVK